MMSRHDDIDSDSYCEHNLGDMRQTPEEKEIAKISKMLFAAQAKIAALKGDIDTRNRIIVEQIERIAELERRHCEVAQATNIEHICR